MLQVHKQTMLRSSRVNAQSFQEIFYSISLRVATKALVELSWSNCL